MDSLHRNTHFHKTFFSHFYLLVERMAGKVSVEKKVLVAREIMMFFFDNRGLRLEERGLCFAFKQMGSFIADTVFEEMIRNFASHFDEFKKGRSVVPDMKICDYRVAGKTGTIGLDCNSVSEKMTTEHSKLIVLEKIVCLHCSKDLGKQGHFVDGNWMCEVCIRSVCGNPDPEEFERLTSKNALFDKICKITSGQVVFGEDGKEKICAKQLAKSLHVRKKMLIAKEIMLTFFDNRDYKIEKRGLVFAFKRMGSFIADTIYEDMFRDFKSNVRALKEMGRKVPNMEICDYVLGDKITTIKLNCESVAEKMVTEHSGLIVTQNDVCAHCNKKLDKQGHFIDDNVGIWMCEGCISKACEKAKGSPGISSVFNASFDTLTAEKRYLFEDVCQLLDVDSIVF
jgi:hypothetical protein